MHFTSLDHLMEDCDGFRCPFNHTRELCIPQEMVCDGDPHCQLKEDEENCTECQNDALFCKPKKICIPKWKLCDGEPNCPDGSDELVSLNRLFLLRSINFDI